MHHSPVFWIAFNVFVLVMLVLDLGVFGRKSHEVSFKEALWRTAAWMALAAGFGVYVYFSMGQERAMEFAAGYLLEQSLSVDNMFVFLLIFGYFAVPQTYQHKVLFWGILGALILRAVFILAGVWIVERFHWILFFFGAFLVYTGWKLIGHDNEEVHPEKNIVLRLFRRLMPVSAYYEKDRFFISSGGYLTATPLFVVLLMIETTDVLFALDSIPAVLGVSKDSLIIYTSNVFAILGLRSLYFALAGIMKLFHHLHYGLAAILMFIGAKMIAEIGAGAFHIHDFKLPIWASLGFIVVAISASVWASLRWPAPPEPEPGDASGPGAPAIAIAETPADPEQK